MVTVPEQLPNVLDRAVRTAMAERAPTALIIPADPVNPMLLFRELSARLPSDAIVTADSGSSANWYARQLRFRGDMRGSLSGNLATMGPGVPYGIGAKFGHPDRPVIVFAVPGAAHRNAGPAPARIIVISATTTFFSVRRHGCWHSPCC